MISCKFIVSFGYGNVYETAFLQTKTIKNASFYNLETEPNRFERYINRLAFSKRLSFFGKESLVKLSFYLRTNRFIKIFEEMHLPEKTPCVVLSSVYRSWEENGFFDYLRQKVPTIKIVYFLTDIVESSPQMKAIIQKNCLADLVISYDKNDSIKYGLLYYPVPYTDIYNQYSSEPIKYDVCFVGAKKDRLKQIEEAFLHLNSLGLKCAFYVIGTEENDVHYSGIEYCDYIDYNKYLQLEAQSRCILEIMQENCVGNTFRVPEAIFLKKKLITNNVGLFNTRCYFSKNMMIYNSISDVKLDFFDMPIEEYPETIKEYLLPNTFFKEIEKWLSK